MPSGSTTTPSLPVPARAAIPPLVPVLLPLIVASILINVAFAWFFPADESTHAAPTVRFRDASADVGLAFLHRHGSEPAPTTLGGGVTVFDANNDGAPDLFLVNGAPWPWANNAWQTPGTSALLINDGNGRFTNDTPAAGLDQVMNGMGAVTGDFDADGDADLFVTCIGPNRLFRNEGDGTFTEIAADVGVDGPPNAWSTGAVWLDYDRDGHLDLMVGDYLRWSEEYGLLSAFSFARAGRSYGTPVGFATVFPTVYRNNGDSTFTPVRDHAGLRPIDPLTGFAREKLLSLVPLDADQDGWLDLLCTFHTGEPALFLNQRDGHFAPGVSAETVRREGLAAGLATAGSFQLSTVSRADDLFPILRGLLPRLSAEADRTDADLATKIGLVALDYDLDGRRDVFTPHAVVEHDLAQIESEEPYGSAPRLYWPDGDDWQSVPAEPADGWPDGYTARGTAAADFDGDGDLDLVVVCNQGPARFLLNELRENQPWLRLTLTATRTHPSAGGAKVELHTPRAVLIRTVGPQLGYLAQSDSALTFGLGQDTRVRRVVITWPSGQRQELRGLEINQHHHVSEPR